MRFLIETYGCQLNVAESSALEVILLGRGLEKTEKAEEADVVILNTCSVRKTAENRVWGRLGYFGALKKKKKGALKIIVTGCMAERLHEELKDEAPFVDEVVGTNSKNDIPDIILGKGYEEEEKYSFLPSYFKEGSWSSYVPIMNGCNNFCSYCIVPYVRGREISRDVASIIEEIKLLDSKKVREITLLGQNVNSYKASYQGKDVDFPTLLEIILPYMDNIKFVRFESPHPKDFSDHLIRVIAQNEKICSHIHLPMQAGSTRILELMNRKTTREKFIALVDKMKKEIPDLTLATDVMVGFPTETEEEYEQTLSMMEIMGCTEAFMYYFNPREGTKAAAMDGQLDDDVKIARLERLISEQLERAQKIKKEKLPFSSNVIVLGMTRDEKDRYLGRNAHNDMVSFSSSIALKEGDYVNVSFTDLSGNTFRGHHNG